ncbi:MAG: hypothetical protein OYH77_00320 [Pseudomonadota bacterium]|nr:hypothetical protein [Pseudomonadota bacterium]
MSLSLHLASLVVLVVLLVMLRRLMLQKFFLLNLIASLKPARLKSTSAKSVNPKHNQPRLHIDYPINFLRNFAQLFNISFRSSHKLNMRPAPIRVSNFLDFYLKHGIRVIHVAVNQQGKPVALLTPEARPDPKTSSECLTNLSSCCGKDILVKVVDLTLLNNDTPR